MEGLNLYITDISIIDFGLGVLVRKRIQPEDNVNVDWNEQL